MDDALRARLARFADRPTHPLPDLRDVAIDVPGDAALRAARHVWARRVVNETGSEVVARRLVGLAAAVLPDESELMQALQRLERDEHEHGQIARDVLAQLGGDVPSTVPDPPAPSGSSGEQLASLVLSGLAIGETISAARYAAVRRHTDLAGPRACIERFLRDETAHSELGFLLVPIAAPLARDVRAELAGSFRYLDRLVGMDAERSGIALVERPQPRGNAGVIEPLLDAVAFYVSAREELVPRLGALGLPAETAWRERWR
jgi:hypothetical protein